MNKLLPLILAACFTVFCAANTFAAVPQADQALTRCLHRAEQMPDQTAAEAEAWLKKGGGYQARTCHAFAQFHRGEFPAAAAEFSALAFKFEGKDRHQAAALHVQAGLAATRANDHKKAEAEYTAALRLEPQDPDALVDRATERATTEHYWDALDDLNLALTIMPDMTEALRLRGQVRTKLGQDNSAKTDFEHAAGIESAEGSATPKP